MSRRSLMIEARSSRSWRSVAEAKESVEGVSEAAAVSAAAFIGGYAGGLKAGGWRGRGWVKGKVEGEGVEECRGAERRCGNGFERLV